jgi:GNAT superfamily N-acetyltransferase
MNPVTITYLEMRSPAALKPKDFPHPDIWVKEAVVKEWRYNRFLYMLVGAEWSWTDRLAWTEQQWRDYAEAESLRTFVAYHEGAVSGYFELRRDEAADIEVAIFGIAPKFTGRGYGGALLTYALQAAWQMSPGRVWLHTCTLDHPAALPNYVARGMTVYKVETEPCAQG